MQATRELLFSCSASMLMMFFVLHLRQGHGGGLWSRIRLSARPCDQQSSVSHVHKLAEIRVESSSQFCVGPRADGALTCRIHDTDLKYYANGEDAYEMRKFFKERKKKEKSEAK